MIKLRSFRLRIALLSAMLAGGALMGFGLVSLWLIHAAKVDRLDAELKNQLIRSIRVHRQNQWQQFEASLPLAFGVDANTPIALLIVDSSGTPLYRGAGSADLNINQLRLPQPSFRSQPEPPLFEKPDRFEGDRRLLERSRSERPPDSPPPLQITTQHTTSGAWRVGVMALPHQQVAIAIHLRAIDQETATIRSVFLIAIPVVLLLVAGGAWVISGSALRPIGQLTEAIQRVTVKGLDQRVPTGATDVELVQLIQVFNQMLERLERSFNQASRFSADAAHELKTPLTILQGELEQTLQQAESGSAMQQRLSTLLDEVQRLSEIVRKLLFLSLTDAGQTGLHSVEVNLSNLLIEMADDIELLAPHLAVQTDIAAELTVWGDRDLLKQVLQNLISNAIKYNLPNGWVKIQGRQQGSTVLVTISNASDDIPVGDRALIFDRFYRGDPARTRTIEGLGLGLSLAREIARMHQGQLTLDQTPSGQSAFTLKLPTQLSHHK